MNFERNQITVLLKEHSNNMTPKNILLYLLNIILLSSHQRGFLLQEMGVNRYPHLDSVQEVGEVDTLSPKWDDSISPWLAEPCRSKGGKIIIAI